MGWRTIIISNRCKLNYKNDYLIIRNDEVKMIYLAEISIIIVNTTEVSITSYLLNELAQRKIKIMFCDEKKNPSCELVPYYGAHNTSKRILNQIAWKQENKNLVWQEIVKYKIYQQATLLKLLRIDGYDRLIKYSEDIQRADSTNREGLAAKVYFNLLFGKDFNRDKECEINKALDYGYSVILSAFNREVVSNGYITQLGINHRNEFNFFNFSCDLMEPYRPLVDAIVYKNKEDFFDNTFKYKLVNVLNFKAIIDGKEEYISNAIPIYFKSVVSAIESGNIKDILKYEL